MMLRSIKLPLVLALLGLCSLTFGPQPVRQDPRPSQQDAFAAALADYRGGRYEQALAAFRRQLAEPVLATAIDAAAELRLNASLCALRLLHSRDAEELVAPLVDRTDWEADACFVLGLASSQHAERAVVAAKLADAEPMAWPMASRAIQNAELQFRRVVALRPGDDRAVRNLERTIRRRTEVEAERAAAKPPDAKKEDAPKPEPPKPKPDEKPTEEVVIPEIATLQLTPKELAELQQRVREQQNKKVRGRQQRSRQRAGAGERDW